MGLVEMQIFTGQASMEMAMFITVEMICASLIMNLTMNDSEQPLMVATPPQVAVAEFNQPDGFNLFDFDAFLSKSYIQEALSAYIGRQPKPGSYTITRLLGGLINVTARATISNSGNELTIISYLNTHLHLSPHRLGPSRSAN